MSGTLKNLKAQSKTLRLVLFLSLFLSVAALAQNEAGPFGIGKGYLVANQLGDSIGGRIIPDRLFFFNSTEANVVRSRENRIAFVPTPSLIAASAPATRAFFGAFPLVTPINGRVFTVGDVLALTGGPTAGSAFAALPSGLPATGSTGFVPAYKSGRRHIQLAVKLLF